jgi:hypothetical protein
MIKLFNLSYDIESKRTKWTIRCSKMNLVLPLLSTCKQLLLNTQTKNFNNSKKPRTSRVLRNFKNLWIVSPNSCELLHHLPIILESCYSVWNQREQFIYPNLIVKNRKMHIERYFK